MKTIFYEIMCGVLLYTPLAANTIDTPANASSTQAFPQHTLPQKHTELRTDASSPYSSVREAFSQYEKGSAKYAHVLEVEAACITRQLMEDQGSTSQEQKRQLLLQLEKNYQQQLEIARLTHNTDKATAIEAEMNSTLAKLKQLLNL